MASVTREQIGNLHDKISVKIDKQDYLPSFESDLKKFSKKANIPGFRKGMVPAGMIKKMYGNEFYREAVIKSAEKELQEFLAKENLEIFGQPIPSDGTLPNLDLQNPSEYEFQFEVGRKPELKIDLSNAGKLTSYKIKVKKEDIDNRVDSFQGQFGELKEAGEVSNENNIVELNITQVNEEGQPVEGGFSSDQSLYVKVFTESFQKALTGKKKDDILQSRLNEMIDFEKYPGVLENIGIPKEDSEKVNSAVTVRIVKVNDLEKHPLNEDLYKKAYPSKNIHSEEELRNTIEAEEQKQLDDVSSNQLDHQIYHLLMDSSATDLPESFLKKLLLATKTKKSEEEITNQMPSFLKELKWSLISQQIIRDNDLKVTADDIKSEIKSELARYFGNVDIDSEEFAWTDSYVNRMMADKEQLESRYHRLLTAKVFDWVKSQISTEKQEISQEDFAKMEKDHQHTH